MFSPYSSSPSLNILRGVWGRKAPQGVEGFTALDASALAAPQGFFNLLLLVLLPMTDRPIIRAGISGPLAPRRIAAPRVPVTAEFLAEQTRRRIAYEAGRAAWQRMLEHRAEGTEPPPVVVCRCGRCGRRLRGGAQLRLPLWPGGRRV